MPAPKLLLGLLLFSTASLAHGEDWTRFRGPNGTGLAPDADPPTSWSDTENLLWKAALPGPGSSSPVLTPDGSKVFLTCYTGYGTPGLDGGSASNLVRHLLCLDPETGEELWRRTVPAETGEDRYGGYLTEHGYASNTPTTDGEKVFVFFGKSGLFAYTVDGEPLWDRSLGTDSAPVEWGSASSPVLFDGKVYVSAYDESRSLYALDAATGENVWAARLKGDGTSYGTPVIVPFTPQAAEVVMILPNAVVAFDHRDGDITWEVPTGMNRNISDSPVAGEGGLFVSGGFRGEESLFILPDAEYQFAAEGTDRVKWRVRDSASVSSPLFHDGRIFWVTGGGTAYIYDAATGARLDRARVGDLVLGRHAVYGSPILAGEYIYLPTRRAGTIVIKPGDQYEEVGRNDFASDDSDFNATPAVLGDTLLIRSNEALYRVGS